MLKAHTLKWLQKAFQVVTSEFEAIFNCLMQIRIDSNSLNILEARQSKSEEDKNTAWLGRAIKGSVN